MAARMKGVIFRVTGLPASQHDEELITSLKGMINENLGDEERSSISVKVAIVPSCYDNEEKAALAEFSGGVPAFLSELTGNPLGDWQAEMGETDINFDQHFFGFTQLYTPTPDVPVTADVIAITGLDGHAYGSWRGKGNLGRMWLRDFLSKDLPCCRTLIYGYNSKLLSHGIDTIMDYGRGLMEELKKVRNTDELRKRPLFFIAHSFGGIILAHCLVKAVQTTEDDHPTIAALHKATYGMLLFGIPHKGLLIDDIQKILADEDNHPRNALLEQIKEKSDILAFQLTDFKNLIRDRKIVSFYETEQTRRLQFVECLDTEQGKRKSPMDSGQDRKSKRWKRTGDYYTAVDADSALLQLPDSIEDKIPLDADHSMIVKFDNRNNKGYMSARDKLRQFEQDAPRIVASRFLQAQNRPTPCMMIPFQRDEGFVGREDILAQIFDKHEQATSHDHRRVALVGLGGVGKSQIAIEYAYRIRTSAPHIWVFWVHASNAPRFQQAYKEIAAKVELPGCDDPKADTLQLVYNWLSDERNGRWLMIVDNADDNHVFTTRVGVDSAETESARGARPLASFLPQTANGCILVTSRDLVAAMNFVGTRYNVIQVAPMEDEDALTLLKARVSVDGWYEENARALVRAMEYIPLAITHAAAYIAVREPRITISTYLELFHENEENQTYLLNSEEAKDLRRDPSVSDAVITSWQISFEQIRKTKPEAADLLSLMAMFDRQGIPEHLLYDGKSKLRFEEAVAPLASFSLIRTQSGNLEGQKLVGKLFEMHSLVQLATRKWLQLQRRVVQWQKASLRILAAAFPSGQHETWPTCRALLPHSKKLMGYSAEEDETMINQATIASNTAWYFYLNGDYRAAEALIRRAIAARETILGLEHPATLTSISNLGSVLQAQGNYKEAEAMHRRDLEVSERALGVEHPDTLASISNLGIVLQLQGKYADAEAMYRRDLEGSENVLGAEHLDTLSCVSSLGSVLEHQGKYDDAEAMHQRALKGRRKVLGMEHPNTLASINDLGLVFESQGKYKEAEEMYQQALKGRERVLSAEHPDVLSSLSCLGSALDKRGKYKEAEVMHRQALKGREKVLGVEHPHVLFSLSRLGIALERQGKYKEAEATSRRALEGYKRVHGVEHPHTFTGVCNLGSVLQNQGRYKEAEVMYRQALKGREKVLGIEHPDTLTSISSLGLVLENQGSYKEAEAMHRQALKGQEKVLGIEHPNTLISVSNLGSVLETLGRYKEAEVMHRQALKGREKILGMEHRHTLISISSLGLVLDRQGNHEEAEVMHRRDLEVSEKVLGAEHPDTLISFCNLGTVLENRGRYKEAEAMHRQALKGQEKVLGIEHPDTLISVNNLGSVLKSQSRYIEAEAMYRQAVTGLEKALGAEHPHTLASVMSFRSVLESQGKYEEVEAMHRQK